MPKVKCASQFIKNFFWLTKSSDTKKYLSGVLVKKDAAAMQFLKNSKKLRKELKSTNN